jgi:hypothetical protein
MPVEKLFKKLNDYLDKSERKKKAHCERIDTLLEKLNEKEKDFVGQLENETDPDKRKRLKIELKIVQAHLEKARIRREDLEVKCR